MVFVDAETELRVILFNMDRFEESKINEKNHKCPLKIKYLSLKS